MKYFRLKYDEVLWEISFANLIMLQATIPVFETDQEKKKKKDDDTIGSEETSLQDIFKNSD